MYATGSDFFCTKLNVELTAKMSDKGWYNLINTAELSELTFVASSMLLVPKSK
jgi:hypothetical protein